MDTKDLKDQRDKDYCLRAERRHRAVTYKYHSRMKVIEFTKPCAGGCGNRVQFHGEYCSERCEAE